ncbi:MAG: hypothetical protein ACYCX9_12330 [Candidatus Dormibacteria bacterium]|jgi:predicted tellurium resistance membrane protein TerC|nr:hypothetical protein [Candidatus Dormibacteraeota bacterium]
MSGLAIALMLISLVLGVVVTLVVALLLTSVLRTARAIDAGAAQVWVTGKLVARNTVHIPALVQTNQIVADIAEGVGAIQLSVQRIATHASRCPGCPSCLTGGGR